MRPDDTLPTQAVPKAHFYGWLALILLLAFALRIYQLDNVPLRGDEAYNAVHWTKTPFSAEWLGLVEYEPNPGALVTSWAWSRFTGTSEFALRYLPLLGNLFGLGVMVALAQHLTRRWHIALLVGLVWAFNPFFVWHAQDARQYSLITALTPLNFYLLIRALKHNQRGHWLAYALIQTYTVYVYYIELFWVAAQGLYVLSLRRGDLLRRYIMVWVGIALLLIPLAVQIYYVLFVRAYEGTASGADVLGLFSQFLPTLLLGDNTLPPVVGVVIAGLLLVGLWQAKSWRWLLLPWLIVPLVLLVIVSTQTNLFLPRYVIAVAPMLVLAVVLTADWLSRRVRVALPVLIAFVLLISSIEIRDYYVADAPKAADWPGLVNYLQGRTTADDVIISGSIDPALEYYYDGPARIFFIPDDTPAPDTFMPELLENYTGLYLLTGQRTGATGQYLQAQAQPIPGERWPGVIHYRPWEVQPGEIHTEPIYTFGEVAQLQGYTLLDNTTLMLYWEALSTTEAEHSILVHLENQTGEVVAVLDHALAGAVISTRTWSPGVIYRDPVVIPVDLPSGEYTIRVGIYEFSTQERLPVFEDSNNRFDKRPPTGTLFIEET